MTNAPAYYNARRQSGQTENAAIAAIAKQYGIGETAARVLAAADMPPMLFDGFEAAAEIVDELTTPDTAGLFEIVRTETGYYQIRRPDFQTAY